MGLSRLKASVLFLVVGLVILFAGCVEPEKVEVKKPSAVEETKTTSIPTPTSTPTPTPTSAPRGTLNNPASLGETVVVKIADKTLEIKISDVIRGDKAYKLIKNANMFNPDPKQGYEYLLVKVKFAYTEGEGSYYVSSYNFKAYVGGAGYSPVWVILPKDKPEFEGVDLIPGGQTEGWIVFEVPQGKETLIAYEYLFEPVCFISVGK